MISGRNTSSRGRQVSDGKGRGGDGLSESIQHPCTESLVAPARFNKPVFAGAAWGLLEVHEATLTH